MADQDATPAVTPEPAVPLAEATAAIEALDRLYRPILGDATLMAGPLGALVRIVGQAEGRVATARAAITAIEDDAAAKMVALEHIEHDLIEHQERVAAEKDRLSREVELARETAERATADFRETEQKARAAMERDVEATRTKGNRELERIRKDREQEERTLTARIEGLRVEEQQLAQAVGQLRQEQQRYVESAQRVAAGG